MDKTIEQIKRAHQGDKTAREALVKDNLGLVWSIVRRFADRFRWHKLCCVLLR